MPERNIALIGGRASGKSTIARELSTRLGFDLLSTDELVIERSGLADITAIVNKRGWSFFRQLEQEVLTDLAGVKSAVIDCGGGIICDQAEDNSQSPATDKIELLQRLAIVFWLDVDTPTQLQRLDNDRERPSLSGFASASAEMAEIMSLRRPWYAQTADIRIDSNNRSITEVVELIIDEYHQ